jgi:hypothetical protein
MSLGCFPDLGIDNALPRDLVQGANFLQRVAVPADQAEAHFEDPPLALDDTGQNSVELLFAQAVADAVKSSPINHFDSRQNFCHPQQALGQSNGI